MNRSNHMLAVSVLLLMLVPTLNAQTLRQEIIAQLRDRDLEAALDTLGDVVDQGIVLNDLGESHLPSAAGAVYRALAQRSADEQYELLEEWSLPADNRNTVRLLTTPVPADAPPKVFARGIGERPRDNTFAVASVGPVPGFFCSGWTLAVSAKEMGRLTQLKSKLKRLVEEKTAGAELLLMFAEVADSGGSPDETQALLSKMVESDPLDDLTLNEFAVAALAAAASSQPQLASHAEAALHHLVVKTNHGKGTRLRPFLRMAEAIVVQKHRGTSEPHSLFENPLKHWIPVSVQNAGDVERGSPRSVWLFHEQCLLHLTGGRSDLLLFRYPIESDFEFVCETQNGGSMATDGGLVYGGIQFQQDASQDTLRISNADGDSITKVASPFARHQVEPVFNRVGIRSHESRVAFESNSHPVWNDSMTPSSPWLGLQSSGANRPVFRNLQLKGEIKIPTSINLISDKLRGWETSTLDPATKSSPSRKWSVQDGVLLGRTSSLEHGPSLIRYQRPLLDGESIEYSFRYEGDDSIPHPVLGRIAFLVSSKGIRVRWITSGPNDWTCLPPDNSILEPRNRRGGRSLPLKESWNRVQIERSVDKILIHLNDTLVYERKTDLDDNNQFGLFRSPDQSKQPSRIRDISMTGDWPDSVPADLLQASDR